MTHLLSIRLAKGYDPLQLRDLQAKTVGCICRIYVYDLISMDKRESCIFGSAMKILVTEQLEEVGAEPSK